MNQTKLKKVKEKREFVFDNVLNTNVEVRIKANYYEQALDLLKSVTEKPSHYHYSEKKLKPLFHEAKARRKVDKINRFVNKLKNLVE